MGDSGSVERGKETFVAKCAACHLEHGQGSIGPNLTDKHWIHGTGQLMDIYQAASEGFPSKGMPPWNRQLTPQQLREVAAYVGSIRGLNVPGKAPEGTEVP
jgi:cytochrome c oxidase cbb3-type subunit 3